MARGPRRVAQGSAQSAALNGPCFFHEVSTQQACVPMIHWHTSRVGLHCAPRWRVNQVAAMRRPRRCPFFFLREVSVQQALVSSQNSLCFQVACESRRCFARTKALPFFMSSTIHCHASRVELDCASRWRVNQGAAMCKPRGCPFFFF